MATGTLAANIKQVACKYTGVNVNYKKTTTWYDGSAMADTKCDGTIYRKLGTDYYVDCDYLDGKQINPLRWGMKGDGVFDNSPIMDKILAAKYNPTLIVNFPAGDFYFSRPINLKRKVIFNGEAEGSLNNTQYFSRLKFAENIDGIVVNNYNTNGNHVVDTSVEGRADGSEFNNIALYQLGTSFDFTYYNFNSDINRAIGVSVHHNPYVGDNVKVLVANHVNATTGKYEPVATGKVDSIQTNVKLVIVDALSSSFTIGQTVTWGSGATGTIEYLVKNQSIIGIKTSSNLETGTTITVNSNSYNVLRSIYGWYNAMVLTNASGTFPSVGVLMQSDLDGCGFKLLARATIKNCAVDRFKIMGINGFSLFNNLNASRIENTTVESASLHGIYFKGSDANACSIIGANVNSSGGVNIYDDSFLGNYYFGCHVSVHGLNAYMFEGLNNFSALVACYSEGWGDVFPLWNKGSIIGPKVRVVGGDHGSIIHSCESIGHIDEGLQYRRGNALELELENGGNMRQEHGLLLRSDGSDIYSPLTITKGGMIGALPSLAFAKNHIPGQKGHKVTAAKIFGGSNSYASGGLISIWLSNQHDGTYVEARNATALVDGQPVYQPHILPYIVGGNLIEIIVAYAGVNCKEVNIVGYGQLTGLVADAELVNGKLVSVKIINPPTLQGNLTNTLPVPKYHFTYKEIYPESTNEYLFGTDSKRWKEIHTNKLMLSGSELKKTAASADSASAIGADYSQSEVQAILDELRDLKNKMRVAGLLTT